MNCWNCNEPFENGQTIVDDGGVYFCTGCWERVGGADEPVFSAYTDPKPKHPFQAGDRVYCNGWINNTTVCRAYWNEDGVAMVEVGDPPSQQTSHYTLDKVSPANPDLDYVPEVGDEVEVSDHVAYGESKWSGIEGTVMAVSQAHGNTFYKVSDIPETWFTRQWLRKLES